MSRFKEGKRIIAALESKNSAELKWAQEYCRMRIGIAARKDHSKHWTTLLRKVESALESQ
jgi:GGDEF domain-containing protein